MTTPNLKRACITAAVLFPVAAYGSFGGSSCKGDFVCIFIDWGVLLGTVGVPVSGLIFAVLNAIFCHSEKSRFNQFWLGGAIGMVAYEIAVACGILVGLSGKAPPDHETEYMLVGFAVTFVVLVIASALYARSSPRDREQLNVKVKP